MSKFNTPWDSEYWMESNGFHCGFNMPEALITKNFNGEEVAHELPPYEWRKSYLVDEYPACPKDWMKSSGRMTSRFVPIQDGKGMWLDFNKNSDQKYHLAIVVSVQGVNAITGLPCKDVQLEQYIDKCPKHDKPFGANRFCKECGYKCPKQNYICTTGTPNGQLWIDGFRAANGAVQQYILTEKTMKGVASNIIGSDRVYAIGVSFFLSKSPKPEPKVTQYSPLLTTTYGNHTVKCGGIGKMLSKGGGGFGKDVSKGMTSDWTSTAQPHASANWDGNTKCGKSKSSNDSTVVMDWMECGTRGLYSLDTKTNVDGSAVFGRISEAAEPEPEPDSITENQINFMNIDKKCYITENQLKSVRSRPSKSSKAKQAVQYDCAKINILSEKESRAKRPEMYTKIQTKNMEVGAGAKINQNLYDDPEPLDFWRDEPESILCINYCLEDECVKILKQGKVDVEGHSQGFLKDVPVGMGTEAETVEA